jgi:hypothetical protein
VKRNKKPPTGKALRLIPSRKTKDGSFLTALVDEGLLERISGTAESPFDATYALTEKGKHAAEFGEYEYDLKSSNEKDAAKANKARQR